MMTQTGGTADLKVEQEELQALFQETADCKELLQKLIAENQILKMKCKNFDLHSGKK